MSQTVAPEKKHSEGLLGQLLASRYLIEHKLGEGAMGAVYRARHVKVGRPFAVKVLHRKLLEDHKIALRFEREAELAGRLHHPNVIGVVDVGETPDGLRYMVMDFAEGSDLAEMLDEAPMPPHRIIHLVRQILEGLYHAHEAGLIHRDLKPENIIVERDDHGTEVPRIVDFGISILREGGDSNDGTGRLTTNGLVLGTPHYMAPEQAVADPIDHRIDLFALGIVIYEMLSGKLPFDGGGAEVARANLLLDPPPISQRVPYLEVDPLLEAFARRLMAKKRDHRPENAKKARELLDLIERDRPAAAAILGVPLESSGRAPKTTQPVSQQHPVPAAAEAPAASDSRATTPEKPLPAPARPPVSPDAPRPSQLEAPPVPAARPASASMPAAPIAVATSTDSIPPTKASAPTTTLTEPLPWDGRRRWSRRTWAILGGAGLATAGAILAIAIGASGDAAGVKPAEPQQVSMTAAPAPAPTPTVEPITDPTPPAPAPPAPAPSEAADSAAPAKVEEPAAPTPAQPDPTPDPAETKPDPGTTKATKDTRPKTSPSKSGVGPTKATPGPTKASPAIAKTDPTLDPGKAVPAPSPAEPSPSPGAPTGDANQKLFTDYIQVNSELAALEKARGPAVTQDLRLLYRRVSYNDAVQAAGKRQELIANLAKIRAEIAKRQKP